jgi:hypothetical protein
LFPNSPEGWRADVIEMSEPSRDASALIFRTGDQDDPFTRKDSSQEHERQEELEGLESP